MIGSDEARYTAIVAEALGDDALATVDVPCGRRAVQVTFRPAALVRGMRLTDRPDAELRVWLEGVLIAVRDGPDGYDVAAGGLAALPLWLSESQAFGKAIAEAGIRWVLDWMPRHRERMERAQRRVDARRRR